MILSDLFWSGFFLTLRKYGGLINFLPLTYTVILIASLSLVAFPF